MASRRAFFGCAICAVTAGLSAMPVQAQTGGVTRRILQTTELPGGTHVAVLVTAEIAANAEVARHTHPGIESAYILEGESVLQMAGAPDRTVRAGEGFQIPAGIVHGVRNGPAVTRLAITYTVEKDKPLASPA